MAEQLSKTKADLGLLSVTVFWGSTFILSKQVLEEVPLLLFLVIRLGIAAVVMVTITLILKRSWTKQALIHGLVLGILLYLSYLTQMGGIRYTTASNAGFITGLSVVFVPVLAIILFKDSLKINIVAGVTLATVGLLLLSGGNPLKWNQGDVLVLICAMLVTFHIIFTGRFVRQDDVFVLTAVQMITISVLSTIVLLFSDISFTIPGTKNFLTLSYLAVFGTVYTFLMQTAMQKFTTATRTALVFSMEPIFAALFAFLIAGELLPGMGMIGGVFIIAGMLSAEIDWSHHLFSKDKNAAGK